MDFEAACKNAPACPSFRLDPDEIISKPSLAKAAPAAVIKDHKGFYTRQNPALCDFATEIQTNTTMGKQANIEKSW